MLRQAYNARGGNGNIFSNSAENSNLADKKDSLAEIIEFGLQRDCSSKLLNRVPFLGGAVNGADNAWFQSFCETPSHLRKPDAIKAAVLLVRHHKFFRNLPKSIADGLMHRIELRDVKSGEALVKPGMWTGEQYFIINLALEMYIPRPGKEPLVCSLYPGDAVGCESMLPINCHNFTEASVQCVEDASLLSQ